MRFTPQYAGLEALYRKYSKDGLMILGFPCDQFCNQEVRNASAIESSCLVNYGRHLPDVWEVRREGPHAHQSFAWLTTKLPGIFWDNVKWNLTKFLIAGDGTPLRRFAPITRPEKMEGEIRRALGE